MKKEWTPVDWAAAAGALIFLFWFFASANRANRDASKSHPDQVHRPTPNNTAQASGRLGARLTEIRQKDKDTVSRPAGLWKKTDDSSTVLDFTAGGHLLIVTAGSDTYSMTYSIVRSGIQIGVKNGGVFIMPDSNSVYYSQYFSSEILPSGELLLVCSEGPHRDEAIIKRLEGRYTSLQPLSNNTAQASGRLGTRLTVICQKDEDTVSRLAGFRKDRDNLVNSLRFSGVNSASDLQRFPSARPLANELTELVQQIGEAEKRHADYTATISQLESAERRLKRREDLAGTELSESDVQEIETILAEVDEQMTQLLSGDNVVRDLNIETVLEQELKR